MNQHRILIVDDDPKLSGVVRFFLEKAQRFEVRVENRSSQALAVAREFRPDVVLLDIDMPGKDGGDVARELMSKAAIPGSAILFLTSLVSSSEAGEQAMFRGGMRFLAKPVNSKVLIDAVDQVLEGRAIAN